MQTQKLIPLNDFCLSHNIEISFISSLQQTGLIEITVVDDNSFINNEQLRHLEQLVCFHYELDINLHGIESITHLLQRMNAMQDEIFVLKNRLRLYE